MDLTRRLGRIHDDDRRPAICLDARRHTDESAWEEESCLAKKGTPQLVEIGDE